MLYHEIKVRSKRLKTVLEGIQDGDQNLKHTYEHEATSSEVIDQHDVLKQTLKKRKR
jgi:hypothetical protein